MFKGLVADQRSVNTVSRIVKIGIQMLNFCGFGFENFRDTKYDFVDFSNDPELITEVQGAFNALTPYKITHIDKAVLPEPVYLSDDDLTALIREIGNCIGYSCYKKLNRNK